MESHYQHHCSRQQLLQLTYTGDKSKVSDDFGDEIKSTVAGSRVCDVTERGDGVDCSSSDVISSSPSRGPAVSHRPYIHRPFDVPLKDDHPGRGFGLHRTVLEDGWLGRGRGSQQATVTRAVRDDEVDSNGDSACDNDDDVIGERQVRGPVVKTTDSHDITNVYTDLTDDEDPTSARPCHYQPEHYRKPTGSCIPHSTIEHL